MTHRITAVFMSSAGKRKYPLSFDAGGAEISKGAPLDAPAIRYHRSWAGKSRQPSAAVSFQPINGEQV
jgi:hypothetical protein